MRFVVAGAPATWCVAVTAMNPMTMRSTKPGRALLTIVSLSVQCIRVKRFYECGVLQENERMGGLCEGKGCLTLSLCGILRFRS